MASAFTIDQDDKQYLITAKHVVENVGPPYLIEIFLDQQWQTLPFSLTGLSQTSDVAVFAPPLQMTYPTFLPACSDGVVYGQDVFFLGFPFGITDTLPLPNSHLPLPLVKRACLSALVPIPGGKTLFLLDGHNNPGFSGGIVVFSKQGEPFTSSFRILGVVSGYRFDSEPAFSGDQELPISVRTNTGIIYVPSIENAVALIDSNPNGIPITKRMPEMPASTQSASTSSNG